MSYLTDMYGKRDSDFIKGFLAAMDTYAVWHSGKRFIGSPEQELHDAMKQAVTELGDDLKNYSEFLML